MDEVPEATCVIPWLPCRCSDQPWYGSHAAQLKVDRPRLLLRDVVNLQHKPFVVVAEKADRDCGRGARGSRGEGDQFRLSGKRAGRVEDQQAFGPGLRHRHAKDGWLSVDPDLARQRSAGPADTRVNSHGVCPGGRSEAVPRSRLSGSLGEAVRCGRVRPHHRKLDRKVESQSRRCVTERRIQTNRGNADLANGLAAVHH
jgi:hypothetical protein